MPGDYKNVFSHAFHYINKFLPQGSPSTIYIGPKLAFRSAMPCHAMHVSVAGNLLQTGLFLALHHHAYLQYVNNSIT